MWAWLTWPRAAAEFGVLEGRLSYLVVFVLTWPLQVLAVTAGVNHWRPKWRPASVICASTLASVFLLGLAGLAAVVWAASLPEEEDLKWFGVGMLLYGTMIAMVIAIPIGAFLSWYMVSDL